MDFPVCPSCGQSVIDDDAEDCPFCGASMKAKPGTKPAAPKSAAAKPTVASNKPGAAQVKSGTSAKPAAAKSDDDDFPFDTEVPGAKTAIQAMPNPSKARSLKVMCPMCETAGYVPPTSVGKDVKCANPKCMVPIFKVPVPTVEAPPPPPAKKSNLMLVGGITAAIMIVGGAGIYFVASQSGSGTGSKPKKELSQEELDLLRGGQAANPVVAQADKDKRKELDLGSKKTEKAAYGDTFPKAPEEIIKILLKQMNDSCLAGDRNRSKPFCRQLAAEACALAGETSAAESHLDQLIKVGASVPYYRIEPNLELFWRAWQSGEKGSAAAVLNAAVEDAQKLPKVGRHQMEIASRLAAALAVAGRIPGGLAQLEGHQTSELEGQLAARVQIASDGRVARLTSVRTVLPWNFPQAVAATQSLITHGQIPAAQAWAIAQPTEDAKTECLAIWAESVARKQSKPGAADSNAEIVQAVKDLDPVLAARVWARAACGRFVTGDLDGAAGTLKVASNSLASMPAPMEPAMPEVKKVIKTELPPSEPLVRAATAAAEIAFAHSLWPDHIHEAEGALELALTYSRGIAPGLPAVSARIKDAENAGTNGLRELLKKELNLKTDDLGRQAVGNYRRALNELSSAAKHRFSLQTTILSRLAESGLKNKVWTIVSDRSVESDLSRRDDFIETQLAGELLELFRGSETEKTIKGALPAGVLPARPDFAVVMELLQNSKVQDAGEYVSALDANSGLRDDIALTVATYLASTGRMDLAFGFIGRLADSVLREEAYRLTAALATQRGQAEAVWKQVGAVNQMTEKASLCRGIVAGLKLSPAEQDLPEKAFAP